MVRYQVQFRPISKSSKQVIANSGTWPSTGSPSALPKDGSATDCILTYIGNSKGGTNYLNFDCGDFIKLEYDFWAVYANCDSVKNAMKIAKPLISQYGAANVQICKIAPASIEIVFEEEQ